MKKFIIFALTALLIFGLCSCDPYADQFNKMQNEINSLKERVERNEESIDILIANTDTEVARLRDYIENISIISDGQNEEVLEKIESLETVLEILKKNTDASDEDRIADIEALEEELATLKTKVTSLDTRVTTLEGLYNTLSNAVAYKEEMESRLTALNGKIDDSVRNLESKITTEINTIKASIANEVATLESLIDSIDSENDEEVAELIERVEALETFQTEAEEQLGIYGTRIEDSEDAIAILKTKVTSIDTRVTTLEGLIDRVDTLEESIEVLLTAIENSSNELSNLMEAYNNALKDEVTALKGRVTGLEDACDTLANNVKANKTNINLMSGELNKLIVDFDTLKAKYEMAVESDISDHYHLNANGELEAHTYGDWVLAENGHYHECTVCGHKKDVALHYFGDAIKSNTYHQYICEECNYTEGPKEHELKFDTVGMTEEWWYKDYPTEENKHVSGAIYSFGSYNHVKFNNLPNYERDTNVHVDCDVCGRSENYRVVNKGNGTGDYLLNYYPNQVAFETYVQAEDEYMLRLGDMDGTRALYLRNYSITQYDGELMKRRWEVEGRTYRIYGFLGQTWGVIEEGEVDETHNLIDIIWCNGADGIKGTGDDIERNNAFKSNGFIIEGDVYFMQFGSGNFYNKVSFYATETGWEETAYGNDEVSHSNL